MASVERWKVLCCVLFVLLRVIKTEIVTTDSAGRPRGESAPEFSRHTLVKPRMYHGREKREISTTQELTGEEGHIHDLTIGYNVHGRDYVLDLRLNRDLIPKSYFERYQHNGQHVVNRPTGKDVELCQYQGRLRGLADSWAAISTCHGISGVIFDGEELHYLEKSSPAGGREEEDSGHFLYRHSDLKENQTCGYSGTPHHILENQEFNRILRYKRNTEVIRGPYNANKQSRYVELVLVVDNKLYKDMGENLQKVYSHCKEIANIINSLYVPLNIFIALVGVVVWTEFDEITLSANGDTTLTNFLHYRRERLVKEHPNDNAQLLTRVQFDGGVVGKALKGPICTYEFSGGVSMDHSSVVGLVATTVAHEMGHNFGMEHDTSDCDCPSDRCIMAPSSSSMTPTQWSSCSLGYLALAFEHGMDYCLRNKPDRLFDSPVCGNGFVEAGEQCDCGLKEQCDNPCCNATSCMLYSNASCATGECCDLKTCHPKNAGSACRSSDHECDLPEYCTGHSEYCPDDVFKMDGETCDRGMAFCYQGSCRTHSDQCRLLWGPSGKSSDKQCYEMNTKGSRHGNCGYNRFNQSFIKCGNENIQCGMLHCKHLNERLEFGMESVAILSHSFINAGGSIIPCRTAIVDLGLNQVDPGLAPDGAKCGDGKMCVNQKCMSVGSLRKGGVCPNACSGNGVCNSLGHCHCIVGFSPPNCDYPGTGGSEDSGPASDPNARRDVMTALYIIFLGIVPLVALIALFMYYTRHNVKHWWKKGGHPAIPGPAVTNSSRNLPSSKQGNKKSPQQHISRGNSMAFRNNQRIEISDPLPSNVPNGSDSDHTSLLPKHEGCNGVAPIAVPSSAAGNANPANLQTNLFGHFKGFSITPIHSSPMKPSSPSKLPSPPSRTPSAVSPPTVPPLSAKPTRPLSIPSKPNILNRNASSVGLAVTSANSVATSMAPDLPPANSLSTSRPVISSPVLDTTTCTAKELMTSARPAPTRPAPQVPVSLPSSNKTAPKLPRPLSSPNTLTVNPIVEEKKGKDSPQSYPTLTRLASFMLRQNASAPSQANEKNHEKGKGKPTTDDKTNSLPRKANKLQIDREALRNLKISNPIPQQDIDVPDSALSVGLEDDAKQVVMRAQSMRDPAPATQRPAIPTFGSMRQPSGNKRPTSIPAGVRPTSPPPPRPPPPPINNKSKKVETGIIGMPGYQNPPSVSTPTDYGYDDCLNLLTAGNAPLANIDEESSPTSGDNIYAVIEESPPERGRKNILKNQLISEYSAPVSSKTTTNSSFNNNKGSKFHYASPSFNDYKSPKPLENSTSAGSIESVGLLSEIVNEIQSRNFESIYSTSTLGKKSKKEKEEAESSLTATDSSIAGSSCSARFPDKSSGVASSNSSLGTYMNAPYPSSNLYGGGGSIYSNLSMRNNPASSPSPNINSSHSSSGSSSGYLNPTPLTSSAPLSSSSTTHNLSTPQSMTTMNSKPLSSASMTSKPISSLVSSSSSISKPSDTAPSNKLFSTFKTPASVYTPAKTSASTTLEPSSSSTSPKENKTSVSLGPENIATYKPYSSSLHRPMGPLAASFKSSSSSSPSSTTAAAGTASTAVHKSSITSHSVDPKFIKNNSSAKPTSVTSPTSSSQDTSNSSDPLPSNLSTVQANKSSLHASSANSHPISNVSSFSTAKPASVVTKPAPAVPSSVANLHKGRVSRNESPAANSPDVVSSCSIGNIGNTGKSPDVLGGKGVLKTTSKAPDVVSGGVVKPQSSNTATVTRASVVPSIHSVHSSVGSTVSKASNSSASKPTSINSSLRGSVAGKHSQAEVKPIGAKQSSVASGGRVPGDKTRASTPGAASKETPGKTSSSGRGATDVGANRTMPAGARVAASKLSHVASLQQKFETAASSGDKSGSVGGRTLSNVSNKTKLTPSTVKKSATVKK